MSGESEGEIKPFDEMASMVFTSPSKIEKGLENIEDPFGDISTDLIKSEPESPGEPEEILPDINTGNLKFYIHSEILKAYEEHLKKIKMAKLSIRKLNSLSIPSTAEKYEKKMSVCDLDNNLPGDDNVEELNVGLSSSNIEINDTCCLTDDSCQSDYCESEDMNNSRTLDNLSESNDIDELNCAVDSNEDLSNDFALANDMNNEPKCSGMYDALPAENNVGTFEAFIKKGKTYCVFCTSFVGHFARHLINHHSGEPAVSKLEGLPLGSKARKEALKKIKIMGTNKYSKNLDSSKASLRFIVSRQPSSLNHLSTMTPCPHCKVLYSKTSLARHFKNCMGIPSAPKNLRNQSKSMLIVNDFIVPPTELLKSNLQGMKADEAVNHIYRDPLIIEFGNEQCSRYSSEKHLLNMVRGKLRTLASLVIHCNKLDKDIKVLKDLFQVSKWNCLISGIQNEAKFNEKTGEYTSPSNVKRLGLMLYNIVQNVAIQCSLSSSGDEEKKRMIQWLEYFKVNYNQTIGRDARKAIAKRHWDKNMSLQLVSDVKKLNNCIEDTLKITIPYIEAGNFTAHHWETSNHCIMIKIFLLNRKKVAEVDKFLLKDFLNKKKTDVNSDVYQTLDEVEKIACHRYFHMSIRGKWGRPVAVLVEQELASMMDILISKRSEAGVCSENNYLFSNGTEFFNGAKALNDFADKCGAKHPYWLKSSKLRKQLATITQTVNLSDSEFHYLTIILGQTDVSQLKNYRLPSDVINTAKVAKLLDAFNKGVLTKYSGFSVEQLEAELSDDSGTEEQEEMGINDSSLIHLNKQGVIEDATRWEPDQNINDELTLNKELIEMVPDLSEDDRSNKKGSHMKLVGRARWTSQEKSAIFHEMSHHLIRKTLPSFDECRKIIKKYPVLKNRKVAVIKTYVSNLIKKEKQNIRN